MLERAAEFHQPCVQFPKRSSCRTGSSLDHYLTVVKMKPERFSHSFHLNPRKKALGPIRKEELDTTWY
ncbi:hypothetical protein GE061_011053 [Apolygus lucorum]|uniref:Uncharacterized protein n=1 Tax=Apolygus lucorum TaxID=248454 RepID=A0A8S9XXJ8_APOLU|nr:hypothetical protein GE061_011053 [Apolygus lucorum]